MKRKHRRKEATPAALNPQIRKTKYHGLKNQGATCYLNSVLQVLYMTEDFREAVKGSNSSPDSHGCIDHHLHSVFNTLSNKIASTQEITNHLGIKKVNEQHDAAECFDKILSCSSAKASEIFQGELTHKNTCSKCGEKTESNSPFWSLPLTLSETECFPVTDAVQKYFQESKICGENQLYCNKCDDKTDSSIKLEMHRHPDVLTLLLKRFKFDYHYMDYVKIKCSVQVPYTLEIPDTTNKTQHYQLYAYVEHSGELRNGHYTAEIKSKGGQWYSFNDSTVTMNRYHRFQLDMKEEIPRAYLLFYKKTNDPLDTESCGASTPGCFMSDVETPQREGGENAAASTDNKGAEDETKNRGEIKSRMGVGDKQSKMTGANDDKFMSANNKYTEHRNLSEINVVDNLNLRPDIDGQSREKPQNGSEKTNDLQQKPETVQNRIKLKKEEVTNDKRRNKKVVDNHHKDCDQLHCKQDVSDSLSENSPKGLSCKQKETKRSDQRENEGKKPEGHCTETGAKHQILSLAKVNEEGLNQEVLQEEHKFHNKHSEVPDAAGINNLKYSQHLAKHHSAAKKYKIISVERSGSEEIIKVLPDRRYKKHQRSKNCDEVRKIENNDTLQITDISTSYHERQEGNEEKPQNDKSFQAREKSERLFGEDEGNYKPVQLDKDTQNNLQGDAQLHINSVTQEITAKIDPNPQNNSKTNDGEMSNCILMQKQKDLLEQQIQSAEKFSTGSEKIENVSESTNLTEPSTEKNAEVSPDVKIQQDGRNQSGKNKRRKSQNKGQTLQFGLVCPRSEVPKN